MRPPPPMTTSMTAGTMFLVWLGELISERGIGNGISILIFAGIIAGLPQYAAGQLYTGTGDTVTNTVLLGALMIGLLYLIVVFQEAQRRIPVQYSRSVFRSGRMYRQSGQTHIPLRVNTVGMIPLIFAFSIVIFPAYVGSVFETSSNQFLADGASWIKGVFDPGIRPGRPTEEYINRVLLRITWGGAFFLGLVAVAPFVFSTIIGGDFSLSGRSAAFGITSSGLIIVVGVVLDTMRQIEAQLLMRQYEGFIR